MGRGEQRRKWPWTRAMWSVAIGGPALCLGGVPPWVVPLHTAWMAALWGRWLHQVGWGGTIRVPIAIWLPAVWILVTGLQVVPWPELRTWFAPIQDAWVQEALKGTGVDARAGISTSPADTMLELARWTTLSALLIASARFPWRWSAGVVAGLGCLVSCIGFAHGVLRAELIYGVYEPQHVIRADVPALMGSFVNPNHQSGLLLLGIFAAMGLALELHRRACNPKENERPEALLDGVALLIGAVLLQSVALLLSLSRAAMAVGIVGGAAALFLVPRAYRRHRSHLVRGRSRVAVRATLTIGIGMLLVVVAQHGAARELGTLWNPEAVLAKFGSVRDAAAMWDDAGILGTGRGTFIDLFGRYEAAPSRVLLTHLECAPLIVLLEWGLAVGLLSIVAVAVWWGRAMSAAKRQPDGDGRRLVLVGIAALAVQNLADASLEFMGVMAPAVALVGGLSTRAWTLRASRLSSVMLLCLLGAAVLGTAIWDRTWSRRASRDAASEVFALHQELAWRPLDARLHVRWGRYAAKAGDWVQARERATAAARLRPGLIDAWLLLAAAEHEQRHFASRDHAVEQALRLLNAPVGRDLAQYLVRVYPDPEGLARLSPPRLRAWTYLVQGLGELSFDHADAILRRRAALDPHDPTPLLWRARAAREAGYLAVALHAARLARQRAPMRADTQLEVVHALLGFRPSRVDEAIAALEAALETVEEPRDLGVVEEQLLRLLAQRGHPGDWVRIDALGPTLRRRPAGLPQRRARERLLSELADARPTR